MGWANVLGDKVVILSKCVMVRSRQGRTGGVGIDQGNSRVVDKRRNFKVLIVNSRIFSLLCDVIEELIIVSLLGVMLSHLPIYN